MTAANDTLDRPTWLGIDFSGDYRMWAKGKARSDVWLATLQQSSGTLALADRRRVQEVVPADGPCSLARDRTKGRHRCAVLGLSVPILAADGRPVPLSQVADLTIEEAPSRISREQGERRVVVEANVRGRDLAGFVSEARRTVEAKVKLPAGYYLRWSGQFEQLAAATERLLIAVPAALLLIFALPYGAFGSVRAALLIFLNVPIAATGGILALLLRGMPGSKWIEVG